MKQLTLDDLDSLSIGSAILGSGGGGDSSYVLLMAKYLLEKHGPIRLISIEELKEDDYVIPLAFVGAPLVNMERIQSGRELEMILETIQEKLQKKPTVLMAAEIGGANAFTPLLVAAKWGLPLLDADIVGRAFPEIQMSSCFLNNLSATPAIIADCLGNTALIEASDAKRLEKIARSLAVSMGSSAAIGCYFMQGSVAKRAVIPGTMTQAVSLGKVIIRAREEGRDPIRALEEEVSARVIGRGTVIDIDQAIQAGFLQGSATLLCGEEKITISFQNEYLLAKSESKVLTSTPDILVLLDEGSGTPISSETLRYGLQVALLAIESPEIWLSEKGLELVGPRAFGIEMDDASMGRSK